MKALAMGSSLAVHAESSTQGGDLLSVTLAVDQAPFGRGGGASEEQLDGDPETVAARAKAWQEKIASGISQRLLSRQNSTSRLAAALEAEGQEP